MLVKFLHELVNFFQMLPNSTLAFNGRFELQWDGKERERRTWRDFDGLAHFARKLFVRTIQIMRRSDLSPDGIIFTVWYDSM